MASHARNWNGTVIVLTYAVHSTKMIGPGSFQYTDDQLYTQSEAYLSWRGIKQSWKDKDGPAGPPPGGITIEIVDVNTGDVKTNHINSWKELKPLAEKMING